MLKKFTRNEKGQAMVEFALITPLLILLLCGIIDFGWIFGNQLILNNAGRDTTRYMAINYNDVDKTGTTLSEKDVAATKYLNDQLGTGSLTLIDVVLTPGVDPDQQIKIYASYKLHVLTPVLTVFIKDYPYIIIDTETTMRLE